MRLLREVHLLPSSRREYAVLTSSLQLYQIVLQAFQPSKQATSGLVRSTADLSIRQFDRWNAQELFLSRVFQRVVDQVNDSTRHSLLVHTDCGDVRVDA